MSKTPILLLFLIGWTPVYAVCDKACNTPFQCYEREWCRFRDNAKADMASAFERLTTKYQQQLAASSQALMKEYQARLTAFEKQQQNQMTQALESTKIARDSFDQTQASIATTLTQMTAQHQTELTGTTKALIDDYQTRLRAFEKAYTKKMAAEAELILLVRESAETDADKIRAVLEDLSANHPWQEAISELKADMKAQQAEIQRLTEVDDDLSKQIANVDDQVVQSAAQLSKVDDDLSKQIANVENRQTTEALSKRLTEVKAEAKAKAEEYRKNWSTPGKVLRDRLKDSSDGPQMVVIPAGTFRMGDIQGGGQSHEQPVHQVSLKIFAMGRYEVTFAEYDKFADATGRTKPSDSSYGRDNRPVINVSWDDATAYAQWLSEQTGHQYRLPTEAEWEYAARAGTETKYWWGNDIGSNNANCTNNSCGDSYQNTAPVGSFAANPFGLFDTAGNVWEWTCSEYQDKYAGKELRCAESGSNRVFRGGSKANEPGLLRSAYRYMSSHNTRSQHIGFRIARIP